MPRPAPVVLPLPLLAPQAARGDDSDGGSSRSCVWSEATPRLHRQGPCPALSNTGSSAAPAFDPIFQADGLGSQGCGSLLPQPIPVAVVSELVIAHSGPRGLPAYYCECASSISSPRVWSVPPLPPVCACSIPGVPATPPSICTDPQPIALPS